MHSFLPLQADYASAMPPLIGLGCPLAKKLERFPPRLFASFGHRSPKMVLGTSLPEFNPEKVHLFPNYFAPALISSSLTSRWPFPEAIINAVWQSSGHGSGVKGLSSAKGLGMTNL
jgi:hypothetical protein